MKNLPLSKLRKRSKNYFRQLGVIKKGRRKKTTIEYIVKKTYEALPKNIQKFIEDPEQTIKSLTNMINAGYDDINPYAAMKESARYQRKKMRYDTREELWREFKNKEPQVYSKFNSYMYRQGLSAKYYWWDHVEYSVDGSYLYSTCELPVRSSGVQYTTLEINYDYSGYDMEAYLY
jgi:hypothetical protein